MSESEVEVALSSILDWQQVYFTKVLITTMRQAREFILSVPPKDFIQFKLVLQLSGRDNAGKKKEASCRRRN